MSARNQGSVTQAFDALRMGGPANGPAQRLWDHFFERLVALARKKLIAIGAPRAVADEEDAAVSAMLTLIRQAGEGRFSQVHDREDLWRLLVEITCCKALGQARREWAQKRGGGRVKNEEALGGDDGAAPTLDNLLGRGPTPDFLAVLEEEFQIRLVSLGDDTLRRIAIWNLEGHTNQDIADRLGCCLRTVAYKLKLVRLKWSQGDEESRFNV